MVRKFRQLESSLVNGKEQCSCIYCHCPVADSLVVQEGIQRPLSPSAVYEHHHIGVQLSCIMAAVVALFCTESAHFYPTPLGIKILRVTAFSVLLYCYLMN